MRELKDKPAHFFGIRDGENMVASGKLDITSFKDQKHAHLSLVSVDEAYRGKGLVSKQLGYKMLEEANKSGCTHIDTEVFTTNPISLVAQFKENFFLVDLEFYGDDKQAGKFILSKKIDGEPEYDKKKGPLGELREVHLSDLPTIKALLGQGWVGIDIKNLGNAKDKNPEQWVLIMEKTTENVTKENDIQQEQSTELKDYFEKAEIVVLAETHHGTHFETIMKFLDRFLPQINGVFFEMPVTYQSSFDLYMETGEIDKKLEKLFVDAEKEGKNIRSLLLLLDKIKQFGKQAICIDSSKLLTEEYPRESTHGTYFLRGESRDEDMFNNVSLHYQTHPGKYLILAGAAHVGPKKHHGSGDDTMGSRLTKAFTDKLTTIVVGTPEAMDEEEIDNYDEKIIEK